MECSGLESCCSGSSPGDSLQHTLSTMMRSPRGSTDNTGVFLPEKVSQSSCCAREASSMFRCTPARIAEESSGRPAPLQTDDRAPITTLHVGRRPQSRSARCVRAVNEGKLAVDEGTPAGAGRQLCETRTPESSKSADIKGGRCNSTTGADFPPDFFRQEHLHIGQQHGLRRRIFQQQFNERFRLPPRRLEGHYTYCAKGTGLSTHYARLLRVQAEDQHVFQGQQVDGQPCSQHFYSVEERRSADDKVSALAPTFAVPQRGARATIQKAAFSPAEEAACLFDRLRMLRGRSTSSGTAANSACLRANKCADPSERLSNVAAAAAVPPREALVNNSDASSVLPEKLRSAKSCETMSLASCHEKKPSSAGYCVISDELSTAAHLPTLGTMETATKNVVGDSAAAVAKPCRSYTVRASTPPQVLNVFALHNDRSSLDADVDVFKDFPESTAVSGCSESRAGPTGPQDFTPGSDRSRGDKVPRQSGFYASSSVPSQQSLAAALVFSPAQAPATDTVVAVAAVKTAGRCSITTTTAERLSFPPTAATPSNPIRGKVGEQLSGVTTERLVSSPIDATPFASVMGARGELSGGGSIRRRLNTDGGQRTFVMDTRARTPVNKVSSIRRECGSKDYRSELACGSFFHGSATAGVRCQHEEINALYAGEAEISQVDRSHPIETVVFGKETQHGDSLQQQIPQQQLQEQQATCRLEKQQHHTHQQAENNKATVVEQPEEGVKGGFVDTLRWPLSVPCDNTRRLIGISPRSSSALEESGCAVSRHTAATAQNYRHSSDGRSHERMHEQKGRLFEHNATLRAAEVTSEKRCLRASRASRYPDLHVEETAAADGGASSPRVAQQTGVSVQAQSPMSIIGSAPSCAAAGVQTTLSRSNTTDSVFACGSAAEAASGTITSVGVTDESASPQSKTSFTVHSSGDSPPQAHVDSLCVPKLPRPFHCTAVSSEQRQKPPRHKEAFAVGTTTYYTPMGVSASPSDYLPRAYTEQLQYQSTLTHLETGTSVIPREGAQPITTSFAAATLQATCSKRPAEEVFPQGYSDGSCASIRHDLPWPTADWSPDLPPRSTLMRTQCEEGDYAAGLPAINSALSCPSVAVHHQVAAVGSSPVGFPSYPSCATGCDFRRDIFSREAVLFSKGALAETLTWTGQLTDSKYVGGDMDMRSAGGHHMLSPSPVVPQQPVLETASSSARRSCVLGVTEERERKELRVPLGIIAILCVLVILRAVGTILFHTDPFGTSGGIRVFFSQSTANGQEEPARFSRTFGTDNKLQTTSFSETSSAAPSAVSVLSRLWNQTAWTPTSTETASREKLVAAAGLSASVSSGSRSYFRSIFCVAYMFLVRLSARRRRGLEVVWPENAGSRESDEQQLQQQHRRQGDVNDLSIAGALIRSRWRRRERRGSSPVATFLLCIVFLIRKIIAVVLSALQIFLVGPLVYAIRSLICVLLRISASFVCTAFVLLYVTRLILERLEALRIACRPRLSSFIFGPASRGRDTGSSDHTVSGSSTRELYASSQRCRSSEVGPVGEEKTTTEASEALICMGSTQMERQLLQFPSTFENDGFASEAFDGVVATCNAPEKNGSAVVGGTVALVTGRAQRLAALCHLSGLILRRSLHASKAMAAHVLPLVTVGATAAVSVMGSGEDSRIKTASAVEEISREAAVVALTPDTPISHARDTDTSLAEKHAAEATMTG